MQVIFRLSRTTRLAPAAGYNPRMAASKTHETKQVAMCDCGHEYALHEKSLRGKLICVYHEPRGRRALLFRPVSWLLVGHANHADSNLPSGAVGIFLTRFLRQLFGLERFRQDHKFETLVFRTAAIAEMISSGNFRARLIVFKRQNARRFLHLTLWSKFSAANQTVISTSRTRSSQR
jgi:hypothetical protein